jgi:hypothetical protein
MIRKIDDTSTDSWRPRARAAGGSGADTRTATTSAEHSWADRSQTGWDPMEVWLRHIDQPRRLRQRAALGDTRGRG